VDLDRTNNDETNFSHGRASCHLAYHGRAELIDEMQVAQSDLLV
jgi:hypothetical protein